VARDEPLIHEVHYALYNGPNWNQTLLIITYDEHGGCYDHVPPPLGAVPPDNSAGEYGFDFTRFGSRVPTVLVSPLIAAGTVFRVAPGAMPLDHTSILKTVEVCWNLPGLTARDAAALDVGAVPTLTTPRTHDPLAGVVVPVAPAQNPADAARPCHLQEVQGELVSRPPVPDVKGGVHHTMPALKTSSDYRAYIRTRTAAWRAARKLNAAPGHMSQAGSNAEPCIAHWLKTKPLAFPVPNSCVGQTLTCVPETAASYDPKRAFNGELPEPGFSSDLPKKI
jgi:phospholipase C